MSMFVLFDSQSHFNVKTTLISSAQFSAGRTPLQWAVQMVINGVYIVSKSGGLIFNHDQNVPKVETEKVFEYPLDLTLEYDPKRVSVVFGQKDGINSNQILRSSEWLISIKTLHHICSWTLVGIRQRHSSQRRYS